MHNQIIEYKWLIPEGGEKKTKKIMLNFGLFGLHIYTSTQHNIP